MRNLNRLEHLEQIISSGDFKRAEKDLAEFLQQIAELQKQIAELKGEKVSKAPKDALLTIRLTNKELSNVKKIAKREGVTISELVRVRVPEISLSA